MTRFKSSSDMVPRVVHWSKNGFRFNSLDWFKRSRESWIGSVRGIPHPFQRTVGSSFSRVTLNLTRFSLRPCSSTPDTRTTLGTISVPTRVVGINGKTCPYTDVPPPSRTPSSRRDEIEKNLFGLEVHLTLDRPCRSVLSNSGLRERTMKSY